MLIDYSATLNDFLGEPIMDGEGDKRKAITLGIVCCNALLANYPDEQGLAGTDKVHRFYLAQKAAKGEVADVSVDDVVLIKMLLGKGFGTMIVGRAYELIEPPPTKAT